MANKIKQGDIMTSKELKKVAEILDKLEWDTINEMGYRHISGGFAIARIKKFTRSYIKVDVKHGIASDCERRVYKDTLYIDRHTMQITEQ